MANIHRLRGTSGTADFTNYGQYRAPFFSLAITPERRRIVVPLRGNTGAYLAYSEEGPTELEGEIYCVGGGSYQAALNRFNMVKTLLQECRTVLLDTAGTTIPTSTVFYEEQWGDQSSPTQYYVLDGDFPRQPSNLNARNIIIGRLHLFMTP